VKQNLNKRKKEKKGTWMRGPTLLHGGGEELTNRNNADEIQLTVLLAFVALHAEPVLLILSKRKRETKAFRRIGECVISKCEREGESAREVWRLTSPERGRGHGVDEWWPDPYPCPWRALDWKQEKAKDECSSGRPNSGVRSWESFDAHETLISSPRKTENTH